MRISGYEGEPGYDTVLEAHRLGQTIRVYLDDEEILDVFRADESTGIVAFAQRDAEGNAVLSADGYMRTRFRRGRVRIVIR
jgi:hypothetical protein